MSAPGNPGKRYAQISLLLMASYGLVVWLSLPVGRLFQLDGWQYVANTFRGFVQPDLSTSFVSRVLRLMVESFAIGALGMIGALCLAIPLALAAAKLPSLPEPPSHSRSWSTLRSALRVFARFVLVFLRAIPTLVWAFLFVRIFGLGPGPAVFAIALSFAGIIGKLYAELAEAIPTAPVHQLEASGASAWVVVCLGVLPQVQRQWIGYACFRWECALRSAAILGIVGAGGIGAEIALSLRYFQFKRLATALLALLLAVLLLELLSGWLRRVDWRVSASLLVGSALFGLYWLVLPWSSLWDASSLAQMRRFLVGFASPVTGWNWWVKALRLMAETLAMAWLATLCAAIVAWLLSPWASAALMVRGALTEAPGQWGWRGALRWCVLGLVRLTFQVSRAVPALVWALLFVLWVGPGPLAGILAIACHTVGILGRLFGEVYSDAEESALPSLEAAGAGLMGRWLYGLMPSSAPRLMAFASFRFEVNLRATAVLGFVGAGGIGDAIHTALSLFHFRELASLLLVLLLCVVLVDTLGHALRHRWLRAPSFASGQVHQGREMAREN